jgi:hypothetical protein
MHDLRGELPCLTLRDKVRVFATVCNGKNRSIPNANVALAFFEAARTAPG